MIIPVILAGGSGSRLWPLSREGYPKPFIQLLGEHTLLQQTLLRLQSFPQTVMMPPLIVTHAQHQYTVISQLQAIEVEPSALLLEPLGRNTAAAATLAALHAQELGDSLLLVMPADHLIENSSRFVELVTQVQALAEDGHLITFGVTPTYPHSGYGYIEKAERILAAVEAYAVASFVEKPNKKQAQRYLDQGEYLWNSGIFMFKTSSYLQVAATTAPEIFSQTTQAFANRRVNKTITTLNKQDYQRIPDEPIDIAVMEKIKNAVVIPFDVGWSDVGSWQALHDLQKANSDHDQNMTQGRVVTQETKGCYLSAHDRLLVTIGIEDHIIVETNDAILVAHKDRCQDELKTVVTQLKKADHPEAITHTKVYRPWGSFEQVARGPGFQVKKIIVNPGASLSLQLHHHRSEHWVVVAGTAEVTKDEDVFILETNQSTYIPVGTKHRLHNTGNTPLQIVEVQSGDYLGEDDIVRFADEYARVSVEHSD